MTTDPAEWPRGWRQDLGGARVWIEAITGWEAGFSIAAIADALDPVDVEVSARARILGHQFGAVRADVRRRG